jgi:hypothetical protein
MIGSDPDPAAVRSILSGAVVPDVANDITRVNIFDIETNLWDGNPSSASITLPKTFYYYQNRGSSSWVSALPPGTNTGVLRYHALRLNSTMICGSISTSDFPSQCLGSRPLARNITSDDLNMRLCAPGAYDQTPWTLSRDRQDITESVYLDVQIPPGSKFPPNAVRSTNKNFTIQCVSNTTRGYFELPNVYNGNTPGPLLDKWPSRDEIAQSFNDRLPLGGIPTTR